MIKVAMLSYWHVHADDYNRQANEHPDTQVVAVWDEIPERGRQKAAKQGVPFYASLDELLMQPDIEGVIVDTPTSMHRDVIIACARAGKHIFTEKVIAPTLSECQEILHAVEQAGVKLTVSLPRLNASYTLAIQQLLQTGELGQLTYARVRLSHDGAIANWLPQHFYDFAQCGGGAMIDLGCHPMYLTRLFLGMPEAVSATYGYVTGKAVEDNAVSILSYSHGAIGVVEAGFVNAHAPFTIDIQGTKGSLHYSLRDNTIVIGSHPSDGGKQTVWRVVEQQEARPSAFAQWVSHIQNNTIAHENIALALDLTKLMEASNRSAKSTSTFRLANLQ